MNDRLSELQNELEEALDELTYLEEKVCSQDYYVQALIDEIKELESEKNV